MKRIFSYLLAAMLFIFPLIEMQTAKAIPAYPGILTIKQSNGKTLNYFLYGDEYVNWAKTLDGYTIIMNANGDYVYATLNSDGDMVASNVLASNTSERSMKENQFLSTISKNIFFSPKQLVEPKQRRAKTEKIIKSSKMNTKTMSAEPHFLVILVNYTDVTFSSANETLFYHQIQDSNYTDDGATGSARDYFADNSFGVINPHFDVYGPVTLPNNRAYYAANNYANAWQMARDAAQYLDTTQDIDFSIYDNDGDGVVDLVHVVFAGQGANTMGYNSGNVVWPHMSVFSGSFSLDGTSFHKYSCSSETNGYLGVDHVGAVIHENSHVFGIPDFYDSDYDGTGGTAEHPGSWDVMASGSYNNDSRTPPNYSMVEKDMMGWGNIIPLTQGTYTLYPISDSNTAYKIHLNNDEYLMFEYRNNDKWDAYLPSVGMLMWHADTSQFINWDYANDVNANPDDRGYYLEKAGGEDSELESTSTPFPGSDNVDFISYFTLTNGTQLDGNLTNIHYIADSGIMFTYQNALPVLFILNASNITTTSATITGTFSSEQTYSNRQLQYKEDGSSTYTTIDLTTDTFTVNITDLILNTNYKYRLSAQIGNDTYYSVENTFHTLCSEGAITSFPWYDGFESGVECWTQESSSSDVSWKSASNAIGGYITAHNGNKLARLNFTQSYYGSSLARLISPVFDLSNVTNPKLRFYHSAYSAADFPLRLYYRTSENGAWIELAQYENTLSGNVISWSRDTISLPEPSATYQISFVGSDSYGYGVALDGLRITGDTIVSSGLNDAENVALNVYPNPVSEYVLVTSTTKVDKVEMINTLGQVVYSDNKATNSCKIAVKDMPMGIYLIKVTSNNKILTSKVVVE